MADANPSAASAIAIPVVAASSLLLSLVSPPVGWWWLQWVVLVPVFAVLDLENPRRNRLLGLVYGMIGVSALFRWLADTIDVYSNLPYAASLAILLLFGAAFGAPYILYWATVIPLRRRLGTWWIVAWAALWVLVEYALSWVSIFPYYFGTGQFRVPQLFGVVGITGVMGLTFLLVVFNGVWGEAVLRWREGRSDFPGIPLLAASLALLGTVIYGTVRTEQVEAALRDAPVLRVAQIQSPYTMEQRFDVSGQKAFLEWVDWIERVPPGVADLIVLPEGASPYNLNEWEPKPNRAAIRVGLAAQKTRADVLIGGGKRLDVDGRRQVYNSVFLFDPSGQNVGVYDKMVPLAFGEYFPFSAWLPGLAEAIGGIGDFRAGDQPVVLESRGRRYAAPICYEAILPGTCRLYDQPDLLVNVTNDAWFGDTAASYQHGMLAAVRATELGVPLFRSTYSGVSFVVEPHGNLYAETALFEEVHRLVEVRLGRFPTFYARWGDWFVALCGVLFLGLWWVHRQKPAVTTGPSR